MGETSKPQDLQALEDRIAAAKAKKAPISPTPFPEFLISGSHL